MEFYDPDTDQYYILQPDDPGEPEDYRNSPRGFPSRYDLSRRGERPPYNRPPYNRPPYNRPPYNRPQYNDRPVHRPVIVRPRPPVVAPAPAEPERPLPASPGDAEHLTIKKSAIADLVSASGKAWAAFLILPEAPRAVGDDIIDRNNAAMHRDALAMHQQNQTRIMVLTDLASRAIKLFV